MLKQLLAVTTLAATMSGCVATVRPVEPVVTVETPVVAVGYYDPCCGYWTGYGWDFEFYAWAIQAMVIRYTMDHATCVLSMRPARLT